jgi:hypothetical protein
VSLAEFVVSQSDRLKFEAQKNSDIIHPGSFVSGAHSAIKTNYLASQFFAYTVNVSKGSYRLARLL